MFDHFSIRHSHTIRLQTHKLLSIISNFSKEKKRNPLSVGIFNVLINLLSVCVHVCESQVKMMQNWIDCKESESQSSKEDKTSAEREK